MTLNPFRESRYALPHARHAFGSRGALAGASSWYLPCGKFSFTSKDIIMHKALKTLGITPDGKLPLEVILSETFNGRLYGLDDDQMDRVRALRDIVSEYGKPSAPPTVIRESSDVASLLHHDMKNLGHEEVWAVFLNASNTVISKERIFVGSTDAVSFSPKDILSRALCVNATGVIMVHNHPSGNPRPSVEDVRQTEALRNAASTLRISFVDHVIIAKGSFYSFAEEKESRIE